jgi:hypothetical protein
LHVCTLIAQGHDNRFRYYSPDLGRYVSADPIGQYGLVARAGALPGLFKHPVHRNAHLLDLIAAGPHLYAYVGSNPLVVADPLGLYHCVGGASCDFTPDMDRALDCFDECTGRDTAITSGRRDTPPGGSHARGEACDVGRNSNPDLPRPDAEDCRQQCFPNGYGQEEENGPNIPGTHFHFQLNALPGTQPGFAPGVRPYQP